MNFIIFASFIIFGFWLTYQLSKANRKTEKARKDFWEREKEANSVRKKSLEHLNYIKIPYDKLPFHILAEDPQVKECASQIKALSGLKIVNLTGLTNTDLKLKYGTANITALSEYDQNYTLLARNLYQWGSLLYHAGYVDEAVSLLEFAISTGTDISGNYKLLATIYKDRGQVHKIQELIQAAGNLNSIMKNPILTALSDIVHN